MQIVFDAIEGQKTARCAFSEKMRAHKIILGASSYRQKLTGGVWGTIIKQPFGIPSMIGL